jgi:RimJ/RimL family protein N-acetyltransferase
VDPSTSRSVRSRPERLATYSAVSTSLALLSDRQLGELVDQAQPLGSGIGGTAVLLDVGGTLVFVKRIPLTDLERRPENVMSTANIFQIPAFCHYGIGGPGFGAWRELAVHAMTTNWVLGDQSHSFPVMYHWRVLTTPAPSMPEELADTERVVAYWEGSSAVRQRLETIKQSSASVALFLEYIPRTLHEWLGTQVAEGGATAERAYAMVDSGLRAGTSFMNSRGLLHFDAHFDNILTDGQQLYFADFGLAMHSRFELSKAESDFFVKHVTYDRCYTVTHFADWLVTALHGYGTTDRDAFVSACANGRRPVSPSRSAVAIITRYAPISVIMHEFYRELQNEGRTTPYPVRDIQRVCDATSFGEGTRTGTEYKPMAEFVVRPALAGDARAMAELMAAVAQERDGIATEPPVDIEERTALFARSADESVVAVAHGRIVGTLHVDVSRFGFGELGMLVDRDWRGRGVGSALVQAAIDWARGQGLHKLCLEVFAHNTAAIALYRKFDFVEEGRRIKQYRRASGECWDSIAMGLAL